jgi:hypothetical protein
VEAVTEAAVGITVIAAAGIPEAATVAAGTAAETVAVGIVVEETAVAGNGEGPRGRL